MRRKQDFYPGQLCLFDRYNFTNMKGNNSITMVSIVRPYKKHIFKGYNQWMVFIPLTQEIIVVPENFLCPAPSVEELKNLESVIVVRNPINLPEFNMNDVNNLKESIALLESFRSIISKDDIIMNRSIDNIINGINKILLKFKFYSRMVLHDNLINLGRISSIPMENKEKEEYDEDDV